jgi:hypothetical protein
VLDTLWKKTLPNKLFHLEEFLAGLTTCLFQPQSPPSPEERSYTSSTQSLLCPVCHAQFSTAWPQQPIGKTDTRFPNRFINHGIVSWLRFQDCTRVFLQRFPGSRPDGRVEWRRSPPTVHFGYYICMHQG